MTTEHDFWQTLQNSNLLDTEDVSSLKQVYQQETGTSSNRAKHAAKWLVKREAITTYQSKVLLKGRQGPFDFGRYRVLNRFTDGPLKGWFQALHRKTQHPVILHFLTGDECQQPVHLQQITNHVKAYAAIREPLIWRVFDMVSESTYRFVVLQDEITRKPTLQSLADKMKSTARLDEMTACNIGWQVAQALQQLHQRDLVYGHLTPKSIWLDQNNQVRLLPYFDQIQRPLKLPSDENNPQLVFAADYMAPELQLTAMYPNASSDIYSLGAVLYYMLTGIQPFPGGGIRDTLLRHANDPIDDLTAFGITEPMRQLINYLMSKQAATRYQSASEVADKLALVLPDKQQPVTEKPVRSNSSIDFEAAITAESTILNIGPLPPPPQSEPPTVKSTSKPPVSEHATPVPPPVTSSPTTQTTPAAKTTARPQKSTTSIRRRRRNTSPWMNPMLWGGVAAGLIGMLVLIIILNQPMDNPPQDPDEKTPTQLTDVKPKGPDNPATDPGENKPPSEPPESEGTQLVSDDGETLWQSPTSGDAVDLSWSPPAGQLFMVVQIADLLNTPVGPDVLQSLGPNFLQHLSDWESTTGFKLTEIRELVFSWSEQEGAFPSPTIVVRLIAQSTQEEILATLGNPVPEETEHGTVYQGSGWNFIVPDSPGLFVMGTKTALTDTLELDGSPPLIRRTLSQLVKQSDRDQHVTLLFAPSFLSTTLFRDGHAFYFGEASKVRQPLQWLLGDGLEAAMVSLHVGDVLYVEARLTAGLTFDKRELVTQLKERMGQLHDKIESHMVLLNPSIYWRALAFRFPLMVAYLHEQTRVQIEGDTPVLNIALPVQATSNLLLASELSIASEPGAVNVATTNGPQKPMNLMQVLEYPFSVDIPQQDLNLAIADIANEVRSTLRGLPFKFDIQIAGGDLMADGITRNQAIRDFLMKDKPLAEVLTGIVMKANPDPTVTSPTMPNQKLIWLITEDPDDPANKIILITTRKAAETNQYTLPAVFVE